ncbi:cAMP-binding protein [Dyadobacter beijingensis]|uniref:cAMP-binding protein n=1 Tax=Dyadobacter beijingensis TaxID=365489 RepID=A0ABQ2HT80_9BACT|nr:Crp/Fnr family transcriptional regulator [Dyadobacter beijingensis]GGM90087.1 cAMP-binding protein [Dyadobacter beijingensis]
MEEYLRSFNILTEQEITLAVDAGSYRTVKKNEYFIREGQVCRQVAFVRSGIFRSFYYNTQGEEITYCFTFDGTFVTAYSSFITQQETVENICAITDAEIFVIPKSAIEQFEKTSINWLRLTKMIAEQEFLKMEQRVFTLLKESAENRYAELMEKHPDYLMLIPLNQLASYLGITQRHLSRIRRAYAF